MKRGLSFYLLDFTFQIKCWYNYIGGETHDISIPYKGNGYYHEAVEVMECVRSEKKESVWMPLSKSLELIETLDWGRQEAGIIYPKFD